MTILQIELPDELREALALDAQELTALAREALLVRLYERGDLSSGKAAELLGISRRAFLEILDRYGVSSFDDEVDFVAEAQPALDESGSEPAILDADETARRQRQQRTLEILSLTTSPRPRAPGGWRRMADI